jgi:hypothetical protein
MSKPKKLTKSKAVERIKSIFGRYKKLYPREKRWLKNLQSGKAYELYCLARVLKNLQSDYGYSFKFIGSSIKFKMAPGQIDPADPHFEIIGSGGAVQFCLWTDIEFQTWARIF